MKVRDIMTTEVVTVDKDERLQHVIDLMKKHNISKLPVVEKGEVVAILSDGHIADELGALKNVGVPASTLHASSAMDRDFESVHPDDDVHGVMERFSGDGVAILPVLEGKELRGVVTKADLLPLVDSNAPLESFMVTELHAVAPEDRVVHARRVMLDNGVERLPVLSGGQLVGVVAETDIAFGFDAFKNQFPVQHQSAQLKRWMVEDVMVRRVVTASPETTAKDAAKRMMDEDVGCLPVVQNGGRIAGMVTRTDLIQRLTPAALSS